jgi:glycosyltransferase involved in cell wall biosynthesis
VIRRSAARRALATADAYVMGSEAIRRDYESLLPRDARVFVLPYGIELEPRDVPRPPARRPLRFGFVGSFMPHKGLHVADEAFRGIDPSTATLHAWGNASASPEYVQTLRSVSFEGTFDERDKARVFASMDVLIVPSIGLESFGLAAREAMATGVPVIATADGALAESGAQLFPSGDAESLRRIVLRFAESPELVDGLSRKSPRPKSMAEHADEIENVYARVLAR